MPLEKSEKYRHSTIGAGGAPRVAGATIGPQRGARAFGSPGRRAGANVELCGAKRGDLGAVCRAAGLTGSARKIRGRKIKRTDFPADFSFVRALFGSTHRKIRPGLSRKGPFLKENGPLFAKNSPKGTFDLYPIFDT